MAALILSAVVSNVAKATEWKTWYEQIDAERRNVRNMSMADFCDYWFTVVIPAQA